MSMQSINLYLPELRPKKEWLTFNTLVASSVGFIALMVIAIVFIKQELKALEEQAMVMENQKLAAEERVKKVKNMPRVNNSRQFDRQLETLRNAIRAREQIGQIIQGQNLGNESGFSKTMQGLARQSLNTISLQHIRVSRGGSFIEFKGDVSVAEDLPRYIQRLQNEESFENSQFGLLSVGKTSGSNAHQFAFGFDSVYQIASDEGRER